MRCWSPPARRSPTPSSSWCPARSRPPSTPTGSPPRWPAASPASCSSTTWTPACAVVDAYAAEHLEIQTRDARDGRAAGAQRRRDLRRRRGRRSRSATTRRVQPRAAHRRLRAALQRPVGAVLPARHPRGRVRRAGAGRRRRGTSTPWPRAEDLPAHAAAVADPAAREPRSTSSRCGRSCGAARPTAPRSCRPTHRLNTNENPHPLPDGAARRPRRGARARGAGAQPLPRPGRPRAARRPGRLPVPDVGRAAVTPGAGVGGQRVQRGAAADPAGLRRGRADGAGLHAVVLDAPDHHRPAPAPPGSTGTGGRTSPSTPAAAVAQVRELRPDVVFVTSPNNPTGTAVALETIAALYDATDGVVVVDEAYAEFARAGTPSALTLLRRPAAAGRQPHDEQGVRHGRAAAGLPRRRPGRGRRAAAGPAALPPELAHPGRRADGAGAHRRAAGHGRRGQGASATGSSPRCRAWG